MVTTVKNRIIQKFTLVEILVSMAVFSILLVLMMQFFAGAKTLWTANEKRSTVYTDASTAFDFMADLLQSTFCSFDTAGNNVTVFEIDKSEAGMHKIYFNSNSHISLGGGPVRYLSFQRAGSDKALYLTVFHDNKGADPDFSRCFWEFDLDGGMVDKARDFVKGKLNTVNADSKIILRSVTELEFEPLDASGNSVSNLTVTPVAVRIKLSLMENEAKLTEWNAMPESTEDEKKLKKEFKNQNQYTFYRTVWLGKRN